MRLLGALLSFAAVAALTLGWVFLRGAREAEPSSAVRFAEVVRGTLSVHVSATGQIQPVTQIDVGTQVSGTIESLFADYNDRVTAGQLLARLDTDNLEARVASNRANLARAEASRKRLEVELENARKQMLRLTELLSKGVVPAADSETAEANHASLAAQVEVSKAEIEQARTTLRQSEIDLDHATITSPIDGVVIQRAVEVGQTVAASFNSPLLFQIANDLGQLHIRANVDEADIGKIQRSVAATFTVDAFPGLRFRAALEQIRLNPVVTNNVVIYTCLFRVDNRHDDGSQGPLIPGLTANLTILVDHREDALLVPSAALHFVPKGLVVEEVPAVKSPLGNGSGEDGAVTRSPGAEWQTVHVDAGSGALRAVRIRTGITDGVTTELVEGDLKAGASVAIGQVQSGAAPTGGTLSPFGGPMSGSRGGRSGGGRGGR